ncbi:NAD(P)/FAD-dependent oxidoreductase [Paucisalibacillus globulus]|uniref:NAD(P)/FAD-dependent oxidoreductase n=1 Tax=Paucisalibacillus globulus TaxID=351095 RepID=UPI00040CA034|nr:FAD-dependent oxidoreductase [Paucisalibacillus globulus]
MKKMTCVVIGGGYAGIHAIKAIQKNIGRNQSIRIILIDPNPYHIKKVLLFKPAVEKETIKIPWNRIFTSNVEIIQGYVTMINHKEKSIICQHALGEEQLMYDNLVITVGSCFQKSDPNTGGISLSSPENGELIFNQWNENLALASKANNQEERKKLMAATVIGAGISGIETSAALAEQMRKVATIKGLNPKEVTVLLINSKNILFDEGPGKLGIMLEERLFQQGVQVIHNAKAICEKNGIVELDNGQRIPSGLSVWTIGLIPNPILSSWDIPLTTDGRVKVDESYRVKESIGIYCIGDCARIVNPRTGVEDQMTCKEATVQARRLGKIIKADILHKRSPIHKTAITTYCFGLGEKQGLVWVELPKINIYLSGKLGFWIRKLTWDIASLVK